MAYPRENLAPGEVVVVHRHPHWKSLVTPLSLFVLATGLTGLLGGLLTGSTDEGSLRTWGTIVILLGWATTFCWWFVRPLAAWRTTHFVVTDRRVMHRQGLVKRSGVDLPISRIQSVEYGHSMMDRMLRTGSLQIQSATESPLVFRGVPRVASVHGLLYKHVLDQSAPPADEMAWR